MTACGRCGRRLGPRWLIPDSPRGVPRNTPPRACREGAGEGRRREALLKQRRPGGQDARPSRPPSGVNYVLSDDFLPERSGAGRPPKISDAELITPAIAQVFLGIPNDRQFLAMAGYRLRHLFPCPPKQPGYNKRLRRLTAEIERTINYLAFHSPGFCDSLAAARLDAGPLRSVARDGAALGGIGGYGYCRSHSRYFWGFRLYLLSASEGRSGVRVVDGRPRRRPHAPRPQGRAAQLRLARPDPAVDRAGLRHLRGQLGIERHGLGRCRGFATMAWSLPRRPMNAVGTGALASQPLRLQWRVPESRTRPSTATNAKRARRGVRRRRSAPGVLLSAKRRPG